MDSTDAPDARAVGFLQAFLAHSARGEAREALAAASEARQAAPDLPEAHYAYGQAWLALNEAARAEQAFAAAIQLRRGWADAWVNYGLARCRRGAVGDAIAAMRRARPRRNPLSRPSYAILAATGRLSLTAIQPDAPTYDPKLHFEQVKDKWFGFSTPN
jgi:tetratricopeptide (TPR) repeat protein